MKTKEIKSKRVQKLIAANIVTKVRETLNWNQDVKIGVNEADNLIVIRVTECGIISSVSLTYLIDIAKGYKKIYPTDVSYYIAIDHWLDIPTFKINVKLEK